MKKVFLFLYPIEEFFDTSFISEEFCRRRGYRDPISTLNECIQRRYRDKGYEVVFATYPDKYIKNVEVKKGEDKIIFTDVSFKEATGYYEDGSKKPLDEVQYPDNKFLLDQLEDVEHFVIGGFHATDCVKRVADYAYENGIDTLVDLELTDFLNGCFSKLRHFDFEYYNPANMREYIRYGIKKSESKEDAEESLKQIKECFSPAYHLFDTNYIPTETAEEMLTKEYEETVVNEKFN